MADSKDVSYSQFACIGSGFSAIALGASLKRWYGITDVRFFERHTDLGGTWFANQYPGCACDVPIALYSFSFYAAPWSATLSPAADLWNYLNNVANEYDLRPKITFKATVKKCQWIEETQRWRLFIRDGNTDEEFVHECQFLYGGPGILVHPRKLDIAGLENFNGPVFHSSEWRHDVDLQDKNVALVGNGCTASQIFPAIQNKTKHLTQFARSKHWVIPGTILPDGMIVNGLYKWFPGFQQFIRFVIFSVMENELRAFFNTKGGLSFRAGRRQLAVDYIKSQAPEKYLDLLTPDFEIGCKRRIFDSGYLKGLNSDNVTLTDDPIVEVAPDGIRTKNGFTNADVIIMATGFEVNDFMCGIEIVGRNGETLEEHWKKGDGCGAYFSTSVNGFPNFFMLLGPNTVTGHTSTVMAIENAINFSFRVIKPILDGKATAIDVKKEAEEQYIEGLQQDLGKMVFATGCNAWYTRGLEGKKSYNASTYPYTQPYFWYQCLFPKYEDFTYNGLKNYKGPSLISRCFKTALKTVFWTGALVAIGTLVYKGKGLQDFDQLLSFAKEQALNLQRTLKF